MPIIVDPVADPGSTLELCVVVFNSATDPSDLCMFTFAGDTVSLSTDSRAEVRQLIDRRRIVRRGTRSYATYQVTLQGCTPAQAAWLTTNVGRLVCVRDHIGTKAYGVYTEMPRDIETRVRNRSEVKLSLSEITHTEAV